MHLHKYMVTVHTKHEGKRDRHLNKGAIGSFIYLIYKESDMNDDLYFELDPMGEYQKIFPKGFTIDIQDSIQEASEEYFDFAGTLTYKNPFSLNWKNP